MKGFWAVLAITNAAFLAVPPFDGWAQGLQAIGLAFAVTMFALTPRTRKDCTTPLSAARKPTTAVSGAIAGTHSFAVVLQLSDGAARQSVDIRRIGDREQRLETYRANQRALHARQDACNHPPGKRERVEITTFGDAIGYTLNHCGACGKPMEDA